MSKPTFSIGTRVLLVSTSRTVPLVQQIVDTSETELAGRRFTMYHVRPFRGSHRPAVIKVTAGHLQLCMSAKEARSVKQQLRDIAQKPPVKLKSGNSLNRDIQTRRQQYSLCDRLKIIDLTRPRPDGFEALHVSVTDFPAVIRDIADEVAAVSNCSPEALEKEFLSMFRQTVSA